MTSLRLKTEEDIALLREGGAKLARIIKTLCTRVQPGVPLAEIDALARAEAKREGATPSFLGYEGYPAAVCLSVNDAVVHGIPSDRKIQEGDIVGVDFGIDYHGLKTDAALTVGAGSLEPEAERLIATAEESLRVGLKEMRHGAWLHDYSKAVQAYIEKQGYGVVHQLVGHGVGYAVHEDPSVPNFFNSRMPKLRLKAGMVLALEPMVTMGSPDVETKEDGWTYATVDGSLASHVEETIVITHDGYEVLTPLI